MTRRQEHALIRKAAAGDRAAASDLIRRHQASLYGYILRLSGRPDVAEDIVQDAFVRALTNIERFDFRFRFSTWLFTIAKRLYVNACQKHKPTYDSDAVSLWSVSHRGPDRPTINDEVQANAHGAIRKALASLSEEQREVIILFHQLDWPISQIAEYMDMPEGTVKSHLHRGRRRMRVLLSEHERPFAMVEEVWT